MPATGRNLTLLTDFYELTMMRGYLKSQMADRLVVFDLFFRKNPSGNGYAITAGLAQVIEYIENLNFPEEELAYLESTGSFDCEFIEELRNFKFTGEIFAVPEGTVVFPNEPLIRVKAPLFQAQLIETALLTIINHQSLIATKAARVCWAAQGESVLEFGLRRAQGPDAGIYGARAAVIGGCSATSNVLAGRMFGAPIKGTHAHSWVMSFDDELTAFRQYAKYYPNACILLVDTYDTIRSGVPNAIKVFTEMKSQGEPLKNYGIRLDSGDLSYLSKIARRMLDAAGFKDAVISASSDLDESLIAQLKLQGACITVWGVGTNLITSEDCPSFGGVYKLASEIGESGIETPKIKLSENPEKITNPGSKKIYRFYDKDSGKFKADLIALESEIVDPDEDITIFDPVSTWKKSTLKAGAYKIRQLLEPIFVNGRLVYETPGVMEIQAYCKKELDTLWDEHKRLVNPQVCYVDLSQKLFDLKEKMIRELREING
ncbi:MAG: nicotinate phosphoribosyltransferase [Clostridiales bacterium]|jgi:nicotinate phosphoribosyltransferase|nr:nicotinate phosphoribosyltransferase [Clostridiales bacterium]